MLGAALLLVLLGAEPQPPPPVASAPLEISRLSLDELLARGRRTVAEMGVYRYTVQKQERVDHHLTEVETLVLTVREKPYAMRLDVLEGSPRGRRVLFNSDLRADEFRVREPGVARILGALWIGVHSPLARRGTNHVVTDSGFGHLLEVTAADLDRARPFGGRKRTDEGLDAQGLYCIRSHVPDEAAAGSYSTEGRLCYDPKTFLPMTVEVWDAEGLLEHYTYSNIETHLALDGAYFTPDGAGL